MEWLSFLTLGNYTLVVSTKTNKTRRGIGLNLSLVLILIKNRIQSEIVASPSQVVLFQVGHVSP